MRGTILRIVADPATNFHEFMHVVDERVSKPPTHGWTTQWPRPATYRGRGEMAYHLHSISTVPPVLWRGFSFAPWVKISSAPEHFLEEVLLMAGRKVR